MNLNLLPEERLNRFSLFVMMALLPLTVSALTIIQSNKRDPIRGILSPKLAVHWMSMKPYFAAGFSSFNLNAAAQSQSVKL